MEPLGYRPKRREEEANGNLTRERAASFRRAEPSVESSAPTKQSAYPPRWFDDSAEESAQNTAWWGDSETASASGSLNRDDEPSKVAQSRKPPRTRHSALFTALDDEELDSDEDGERLDPAWGINPMDSTQILQKVNRSTSFPDFVEQPQTTSQPPPYHEQLPSSEAQTIMQEVETASALDEEVFQGIKSHSEEVSAGGTTPPPLHEPDFLEPTTNLEPDSQTPENMEARFDEGVPLIQPTSDVEEPFTPEKEKSTTENLFTDTPDKDEPSFFDYMADKAEPMSAPPALDRKTTNEVFEGLHFAPHVAPDSPVRQDSVDQKKAVHELEKSAHAAVDANGGQEQDDADAMWRAALEQSTQQISSSEKIEIQDDADAMWRAALEDDEFLIEDADDLLPDSSPGSPSFADLLKSDDADLDFLKDESSSKLPQAARTPVTSPLRDFRPDHARQISSGSYTAQQSAVSNHVSPTTHGRVGLTRAGLAPMNSFQHHLQRTAAPSPVTESFVDQAKGGYKSPYDLPLELSKPRKRAHVPQPLPTTKAAPPPPRTSSMSTDKELQSPFSPTNTTFPALGRSVSAQVPMAPPPKPAPAPNPTKTATSGRPGSSSSSFFEELPITSRPRPATSVGRYTPQPNVAMPPPPPLLPRSPPMRKTSLPEAQPAPPSQSSQPPSDPYAQYQLRPPERIDPYANLPLQTPLAPPSLSAGPPSNRYSPAPGLSQAGSMPVPASRYSPAPPPPSNAAMSANRYASQPSPPSVPPASAIPPPPNRYASQPAPGASSTHILPFQPRTSSPLAFHGKPVSDPPPRPEPPRTYQASSATYNPQPPPSEYRVQPGSTVNPSPARPSDAENFDPMFPLRQGVIPPKRSQTQSPGMQSQPMPFPSMSNEPLPRPATVMAQTGPSRSFSQIETAPPSRPQVRQRGLTNTLNFVEPIDGQEYDELKRWRGAPIFRFGFSGTIISSFPKHIPRYTAGMGPPMVKPSPGEVSLRSWKDVLPLSEHVASFPGPLRAKSKKKDVLSWLTNYLVKLEAGSLSSPAESDAPESQKRYDEKVLFYKIMRALVEHDGVLDSGADALKTVNRILYPELFALDEGAVTEYRAGGELSGIYKPGGGSIQSDPIDPLALETLRKHLLRGDREKAVWSAVDNRLWAHALLISSTIERTTWKQVVQEFVKQEVKVAGANTQSLAAVYEVFAGNLEESIDELVPPSARAGLQMVSKSESGGPAKNALDGLDRWRETLGLVINNRSPDDSQALSALGRLLASYGRIEAAHICLLFAKSPSQPFIFGGADDPSSAIVLLGANHKAQPFTFASDEDAIMLTEVYEFATNVLAGSQPSALPHLQAYKLQRAFSLAENGRKSEAQSYCEAVASSLKSTTKLSPYFNHALVAELEELSSRLKQAPVQGSSSWITKPTIEKVSGTVWNKFTSFVAGDDSDAESKGSGKDASHEFGPFAKVTGTPSLSRTGSLSDIYGSYPSIPQNVPNTAAGSRYAPNGFHTARSSTELNMGRSSLDFQRSPPVPLTGQNYRPTSLDASNPYGATANKPVSYQTLSQSPPATRYQATPPQTSYMPYNVAGESPKQGQSPQRPQPYIPTPPPEQSQVSYVPSPVPVAEAQAAPAEHPSFVDHPPADESESHPAEAPQDYSYNTNYEAPAQSYGYEPPAQSGYVPYEPETNDDSDNDAKKPKPKKKSFMDDDEDDFSRASTKSYRPEPSSSTPAASNVNVDSTQKRENDAAAEAAFRAAAEADAAREKDKALKTKGSGWLGGWFAGKKPDSLDAGPPAAKGADAKVHRVHLGESKMTLYYDKELKKWVDPSNPDSLKTRSATPPPPKMGMTPPPGKSLPSSASHPSFTHPAPSLVGPPSGSPSRVATPADAPPMGTSQTTPGPFGLAGPPILAGAAPSPSSSAPPSGPPSRPATGMKADSSIDDLLGPAGTALGTGRRTIKGKKGGAKGRYVDVMAK